MALFSEIVYKDLNTDLIKRIISQYDIGDLAKWWGMPAGWQNFNLHIVTTGGDFVLRIYRHQARSLDDIKFELAVLDHLAAKGLPVANAIATRFGEKVIEEKVGEISPFFALFAHIRGEHVSPQTKELIVQMANCLADLHKGLEDLKISGNRRKFQIKYELLKTRKKILTRSKARPWGYSRIIKFNKFLQLVEEDLKNLLKISKDYKQALEKQSIIHGDFHSGNLRFENGEISGIFDFDNMMFAPRVYDLAILIGNLYLQNKVGLELDNMILVVEESYGKYFKLENIEKKLLLKLIHFWFYKQMAWTLKEITNPILDQLYSVNFKRLIIGIGEVHNLEDKP
ncbi:MAG TPA: phosphotransferase [Patescibacteria group bacterium]